jgi:hypothetical protein
MPELVPSLAEISLTKVVPHPIEFFKQKRLKRKIHELCDLFFGIPLARATTRKSKRSLKYAMLKVNLSQKLFFHLMEFELYFHRH